MKKQLKMLLTGLILASTVAITRAKEIEDFKDGKNWGVYREGFKLTFEKKSPKLGNSAKISWGDNHFKFLEFHKKVKKDGFLLKDKLTGTVSFYAYTDTPEQIIKIALRLLDAKGEVFQIRQNFPQKKGKWVKISFKLSPDMKFEHWGGNKDGKVDFPIKLLGISMDFNKKIKAPGSIYIDKIELLP